MRQLSLAESDRPTISELRYELLAGAPLKWNIDQLGLGLGLDVSTNVYVSTKAKNSAEPANTDVTATYIKEAAR